MIVETESGRLRAIYDRIAPTYDRAEALTEWLFFARLRRRVLARARGRILEVAVGTGLNLPYYQPASEVTGLDLSRGMLKLARHQLERLGRPARLVQADAERLPLQDATFDTVVSSFSLCTIPSPELALAEMVRACRPGGRILVLEHGRGQCEPIGRCLDWVEPRLARRMGCHPNRRIVDLVRSLGLSLEVIESHFWGAVVALEIRPNQLAA